MPTYFWPEFGVLCGTGLVGVACVTPYSLVPAADALKQARQRVQK